MQKDEERGALRGRDIVCFSHDWTGDPLSKTHLMRVLARDNRILWVNALPNRMPTAASKDLSRIAKKLKSFAEPVREVEKNIFVLNPLVIPAYSSESLVALNRKILVRQIRRSMRRLGFENVVNMIFNPAAGLIAGHLGESELIYYCVDEYTAFTGVATGLKEIEEDLFRRSDVVIVSAEKLLESKAQFNSRTHLIRHGTDWQHFRKAIDGKLALPADVADLPRPIIGFHGLIADWVDLELVTKIAEQFATGSVVLVGKHTIEAETKVSELKNVPNVHILGRKPYGELPAYCAAFDVAINPFVINELTLAANPLKVREYLAAGLPVVSTDIPEVRVLKDVLVGESHEGFIEKIEYALANPKPRAEVSDAVRAESWEAKVDELRAILEEQE